MNGQNNEREKKSRGRENRQKGLPGVPSNKSEAAKPVLIRDRIKELRRVRAGELAPNTENFRLHPRSQMAALRGVLNHVGFAGALIARELPDGTLAIDRWARAGRDRG